MFESIYHQVMNDYYELRSSVLSISASKHERCYLLRFDRFLRDNVSSHDMLNEGLIDQWLATLSGKSSSIENEVIVVRQFLHYLSLSGEKVFIPAVPKVHEDYIPYLFSDDELSRIFNSADRIIQHDRKADPMLPVEFPVILRLLYSCGLRIGETVRIDMRDVDVENGLFRLVNTKGDKQRCQRVWPISCPDTSVLWDLLGETTVGCFLQGYQTAISQTGLLNVALTPYLFKMISGLITAGNMNVVPACTA